ncbi:protein DETOXIFICATION 16-like [Panicum miliaceum]|uniref:Protein DETOXIFICATION n=1 Tax=Panicum miliaceum TaxID=4540 RepID=A0A3L6R9A6_PANMI|nr:protein DETOXIFICATION 16-like [Panicum miliaceum]
MENKAGTEETLLLARPENTAVAEAKRLLRLAGPLVASCILQNAVQLVSVMFVGHLGELPLAGASLASSLANVTGFSLLSGMASALDTFCGQAFGSRQYGLLGVYKQRAMLVLALACVPIAVVWANAGQILILIGQDHDIAEEAGAYSRWLIPCLVPYVPLACHIRFVQTQGIVVPVMASSGVTALSHVFVCWALVFKAGMGSKGAALSNAISYCVNLAMLALYVRLSGACTRTWTGFSTEAFKELRRFTELAIPSAMMVCLEWWSFELLVLLSGLLPNPKLETSVLSICLNTGSLLFMIPFGLCTAISTRVSNELGAGQPHAAKLATRVVMCIAMSAGLVLASTMILLRNFWGYMYSNEPEVITYIAKLIPVLAISFFTDGLHSSLSGVLIGCGEQKVGARVNLGAFYMVGVPMAVLLAFVLHLNGMGLWLGIVCGSLTKLVLLMWITLRINWEKEATKAKETVFSSSLPIA